MDGAYLQAAEQFAGHSSSFQGWPLSAVSWNKEGSFELSSVLLTQFVFLYTNVFLSSC